MASLSRVMCGKARHLFYQKKAALLNDVTPEDAFSINAEEGGKDIMSILSRFMSSVLLLRFSCLSTVVQTNMAADPQEQLTDAEIIGQMSLVLYASQYRLPVVSRFAEPWPSREPIRLPVA